MILTFEPESHIYKFGTEIVPSVTQILKELKISRDYDNVDSFYRDRGSAVHKAIELYLKGTLDESSIDPVCLPYFSAFKRFHASRGNRFECELPLYSQSLNFGGTIDLIEHVGDSQVVIYDAKCTESVDRATDLQLCAYQLLFEQNRQESVIGKFPLQLKGDGTFDVIVRWAKTPANTWLSIIGHYDWKMKRK